MSEKPQHRSGYGSDQTDRVRRACLYVATRLGDFRDDLIVVGGLVPTLLCDAVDAAGPDAAHVGTLDLDLGLEVSILNERRYAELTQRLRDAGFAPDRTARGHTVRQRWRMDDPEPVTIDFLIPPSREGDRGGDLRDIQPEFAAIIAPGLLCAFRDKEMVPLSGEALRGGRATRDIQVCGPGGFVVMKAQAYRIRGEPKDAYDLAYLLANYGRDVEDVAARLRPLLDDPTAREAVQILEEDFAEPDLTGPLRAAEFIHGQPDEQSQADTAGFVRSLLRACEVADG